MAARLGQRIGDEAMTSEPADRAGAVARQEVGLLATVVDEDDVARHQGAREACDPAFSRGAGLPPAAEGHGFGHAPAQILAGRA